MKRRPAIELNVEGLLKEARNKAAPRVLSPQAEKRLVASVRETLNRYLENFDEQNTNEIARIGRTLDHLHGALAELLPGVFPFDPDDVNGPFVDSKSAFKWLQETSLERMERKVSDPADMLDRHDNWLVRTLWTTIKEVELQWSENSLHAHYWYKYHWNSMTETKSRLPDDLQYLISDLCEIWRQEVDPRLGLPSRDPHADNPLLRFIDICLRTASGSETPPKKTILAFLSKHLRPALRMKEKEEARQRENDSMVGPVARMFGVDPEDIQF